MDLVDRETLIPRLMAWSDSLRLSASVARDEAELRAAVEKFLGRVAVVEAGFQAEWAEMDRRHAERVAREAAQ
jgi:hypothetical protein